MALTEKEIHKKADELFEAGITPTLAKVRKALGGGSYTDITPGMQTWKAKQAEEQAIEEIKESAPERITERLKLLGAEVWQVAQDMANDRLKSEREALEKARVTYEDEVKQAADLADDLAQELEISNTLINTLTAERDEVSETNGELVKKNESQEKEIAQLLIDVTKNQDEVKKLDTKNKALSNENASLSGQVDSLEKEKKEYLLKIESLNNSIGAANQSLKDEIKERANDTKKHTDALNEAKKSINSALLERDEERKKLSDKINKDLEDAQARNDAYNNLVSRMDALRDERDKAQRERYSLEFELKELNEKEEKADKK